VERVPLASSRQDLFTVVVIVGPLTGRRPSEHKNKGMEHRAALNVLNASRSGRVVCHLAAGNLDQPNAPGKKEGKKKSSKERKRKKKKKKKKKNKCVLS
jgi:hypothetical protein